jgi:glycosyltransferase family protein
MILTKIEKELGRLKKRLFFTKGQYKELERLRYRIENIPYELYDKIVNCNYSVCLPLIKTADETLDKILEQGASLSRFGDGEFVLMGGGRIHYQQRSPELAARLKEVIASRLPNLLIALPPCFGSLDDYLPPVADFWVKCMARKRQTIYTYLDMERDYYNAFVSRIYIQNIKTDEHYARCAAYYEKVKRIWTGRDVVICEGEGTRFGMFNDLLEGAASITRVLCPARNAFDRYRDIRAAFERISKDKLVLIALGPTATVLSNDLCAAGFQALDIGALDVDYEWFLRRETRLGVPLEYKYVDSGRKGRTIQPLDDPEYRKQIIERII